MLRSRPQLTIPPPPTAATALGPVFRASVLARASGLPNFPSPRTLANVGPGVLPAAASNEHSPRSQLARPSPGPLSERLKSSEARCVHGDPRPGFDWPGATWIGGPNRWRRGGAVKTNPLQRPDTYAPPAASNAGIGASPFGARDACASAFDAPK